MPNYNYSDITIDRLLNLYECYCIDFYEYCDSGFKNAEDGENSMKIKKEVKREIKRRCNHV